MNIFSRVYRAIRNDESTAEEDKSWRDAWDQLAKWLGIDSEAPKALQETTYYTCLKVLSETMGKLPLKCYVEDDNGGRVRAPTDRSIDRLLYRPNTYMTPATFWTTMEANCQHYGNAYA